MKKQILSTLVILFIFNNVFCQEDIKSKYPIDIETQLITYQEVVQEEGTKNELFNRCINWLNNFYNNPVSVTKVRDNKTGKIRGNHRFRLNYFDKDGNKLDGAMVLYSFVIELKDGRYRYTITDFVLKKVHAIRLKNGLTNPILHIIRNGINTLSRLQILLPDGRKI
jgi:hypothetical protein